MLVSKSKSSSPSAIVSFIFSKFVTGNFLFPLPNFSLIMAVVSFLPLITTLLYLVKAQLTDS